MQIQRKRWKSNAIFLIAIWVILLISSLTILSSVVTPFLQTLQTESLVSLDWSGCSVSSNVLFPQPLATAVYGSWKVPTVNVTPYDAFSAVWVGIGGQTDESLIQVGTEQDSLGGQASYYAWYELLPDNSIPIPKMEVSPGDDISASVTLVDSDTNEWLIQITDVTNGQGFSQTFQYNSSRLTAEWIVERPTVNNQISQLANFGSVTFTAMTATIGGTTGTASAFPNYEIIMENRQNEYLVDISSLSNNGSSFTVTYRV